MYFLARVDLKSEYKRVNITTQVKQFYAKVVKTQMAEVKVGENESIESALKRFKKKSKKLVFCLKSKDAKLTKNLA